MPIPPRSDAVTALTGDGPVDATAVTGHDDLVVDGVVDGLAVLDEVPELAAALAVARRIDRLTAELIDGLMRLVAHDIAEIATGVALEQWLAIVGRRTGADRRMLLTTCEVLDRLPSLHTAFLTNATVSFAQVRTVVLKVCRLPRHLDDAIDAALAPVIAGAAGADPDALGFAVNWALAALDTTSPPPDDTTPAPAQFFAMQPRLDGTGGRVWGEFGPTGFATLDAALNTATPPPDRRTTPGFAAHSDPDTTRHTTTHAGAARAKRLLELLDHDCTTPDDSPDGSPAGRAGRAGRGGRGGRAARRPQLLVRINLDTLLDRDQLPTQLLTTLTGGHLWANTTTIRQLITTRGADLRAVVLEDTGTILGVGRRTRIPPDWLTDATLAIHDTCTAPGCRTAARLCELDHATPWHPTRPDTPPGRTDLTNLAPVCATDNHTKEPDGWTATQHPNGTRHWHHQRTGLHTRTLPATWHPPPPEPRPPEPAAPRTGRPPPDPSESGHPPSTAGRPPATPDPDLPF